MMRDSDDELDGLADGSDDQTEGPSRSQQRRDALAVLALGAQLVDLSEAQLDQLPMVPEDLREEIRTARKVTSNIARKRALQYLAKIMRREEDDTLEAIRSALDYGRADARRDTAALHRVEIWRDRLLAEGDVALAELLALHPGADRQRLRQLARNALDERTRNKPPHAARELFRLLRDLLTDAAPSP